jgi:hypothetical protein
MSIGLFGYPCDKERNGKVAKAINANVFCDRRGMLRDEERRKNQRGLKIKKKGI